MTARGAAPARPPHRLPAPMPDAARTPAERPAQKVVVITGASGGIGAALARALADRGHALVLAARRAAELERVADDARARGAAGALAVAADVTRRVDVLRLRDAAVERFGGFDVWVNNAGRGISRSVLDLTDADVDDMIAVNLKSALHGMQAAVPYLEARGGGQVVNVSSSLGRLPTATHRSAYSAAKAALNTLTSNLRMELLARGSPVRVTLVMPGMVHTDFQRNAGGTGAPTPAGSPAARMRPQAVEEVAAMIADAIETPVAELYTNPASHDLVREYHDDVAAFEARHAAPG